MRSPLLFATFACVVACSKGETPAPPPAPAPATPSASAASAAAPAPAPAPAQLNVLLLSIDSLRADMPWAGYPRPIAPRLTALEGKAVSYTRAYAVSSYTSMSLGGLLSGKLPSGLKRSGYFFGTYPEDDVFFPEILHASGVRTIAAHAHGYFKKPGFEQGFDRWELVPDLVFKNETDPNVTSPKHEALAEQLLSDPKLDEMPFFAWFHFLDPHDEYVGHEKDGIPPYGKTLRDRYDAEVTFTDQAIGKLLDFVATKPWASRTAIIVTSDHGEAFGEHGRYVHGFELWENLVRVPLFVVLPGVAPRRIDTPRSAIDLAPTIVELLGAKGEAPDAGAIGGFEGQSLVAELRGAPAAERDVVVDLPMTSDNDKRRALVHGRYKAIAFGKDERLEVYDVEADPEEAKPIVRGEVYDDMTRRYRELAKSIKEVTPYACGEGCLNRAYAQKDAGK